MARLLTPSIGLIVVLITAASANLKTSCGRSNARARLASLHTSHAPHRAYSVLPPAIPRDVKIFPVVVRMTRNSPTKLAGQPRYPRASNAASAIPSGGQTGDAL